MTPVDQISERILVEWYPILETVASEQLDKISSPAVGDMTRYRYIPESLQVTCVAPVPRGTGLYHVTLSYLVDATEFAAEGFHTDRLEGQVGTFIDCHGAMDPDDLDFVEGLLPD